MLGNHLLTFPESTQGSTTQQLQLLMLERPGCTSQPYSSPACKLLWHWTSQGFSFLTCKMGVIIALALLLLQGLSEWAYVKYWGRSCPRMSTWYYSYGKALSAPKQPLSSLPCTLAYLSSSTTFFLFICQCMFLAIKLWDLKKRIYALFISSTQHSAWHIIVTHYVLNEWTKEGRREKGSVRKSL